MIDVSPKFNTLRYAKAEGFLYANTETLKRIKERSVPKGDVLEVARAAGISAAKRTSDWIVFCHPIPLDWIGLQFEVLEDHVKVVSEVKSVWKTGVEMEALAAVTAALLNIYDMLKPLDDDLTINEIRVIEKKGGKSSFKDSFPKPLKVAVLVISDSTFYGKREDKSGRIIQTFLANQPVQIECYEILPDVQNKIESRLRELVDDEHMDLVFTTGGTGLGPKDLTPEAVKNVIEREVPGIAEAIRSHGKERTPYAMLSRELVGVRHKSLIITMPGSSKGAQESLEALFPGLLHAFSMLWGGGHDDRDQGAKS
ncbi:bifunctional molybdenum cofactor biosynthesis protein MoaC/MoaB [candidate division KSB1 bacterium]|nr:bifunctional molybdenum cofactor biosynthesis protein MoaC/MoaB [candidate division KSB1 bacterium]